MGGGSPWPRFSRYVKLYHEESKAAREQAEGLLEKYRTNMWTLLALASQQLLFLGFSTGPRQLVFYWISIGFFMMAVAISFLIFKPIPMKLNVAYNTARGLAVRPLVMPAKIYIRLRRRPPGGGQARTQCHGRQIRHRHSLSCSHRRDRCAHRLGVAQRRSRLRADPNLTT